ncbi:MAG TPA: ABC transporter permease, partial [Methylomirabilota bacterium]|nr:ABC transporter permease [Methylomirabilota bacterium]
MNGKLVVGAAIAGLLVLLAVAGPWVTPHDPNRQDLGAIRLPPVWAGGLWVHPFGTDSLGRDVSSRLLWGARVAVVVAVASAVISALVGVPVALVAGYWRGRVDTTLMRLVDVWMSIPAVLLAIALMAVLGLGLWKVVLAIVIVDWTRFARVVRGEVLALREREFVEAARAIGLGPLRVMGEELLPNLVPLIIVLASLEMAIAVGVEALLSFVGLGLWKVVLAIVIVDWTRFARVIRGEVLALREREFVEAARAIGLGPLRVMAEELLPNLVPLIIVLASLEMAIAVGVEALLSFVGLGVQASVPSWGAMIAEGRGYLMVGWWGMGLPMLALILAVIGFNLLGE